MSASTPQPLSLEGLPIEGVALIVRTTNAQGHTLNQTDLGNLRLTSRRIQKATFNTIAPHWHKTRKVMLSRPSLQCLLDIANDEYTRTHVQEIAIGPELPTPDFEKLLNQTMQLNEAGLLDDDSLELEEYYVTSKRHKAYWQKTFQPTCQRLEQEQAAFSSSGLMVRMLTEALQKFPNLQRVRLDSYPLNLLDSDATSPTTYAAWTTAWGTKTLLKDMGYDEFKEVKYWPSASMILSRTTGERLAHHHYEPALQSLAVIKHKKWTLDLCFHALQYQENARPFNLQGPNWLAVRDHLRTVSLSRALENSTQIIPYADQAWCDAFLADCQTVTSLSVYNAEPDLSFFLQPYPSILHLTLRGVCVPQFWLEYLLIYHAGLLQIITLIDVTMLGQNQFPEHKWDDAIDPKDTAWFRVLDRRMAGMPNLEKCYLVNLAQHDRTELESSEPLEDDTDVRMVFTRPNFEHEITKTSLIAGVDIKSKLQALAASMLLLDISNSESRAHATEVLVRRKLKVWFLVDGGYCG